MFNWLHNKTFFPKKSCFGFFFTCFTRVINSMVLPKIYVTCIKSKRALSRIKQFHDTPYLFYLFFTMLYFIQVVKWVTILQITWFKTVCSQSMTCTMCFSNTCYIVVVNIHVNVYKTIFKICGVTCL